MSSDKSDSDIPQPSSSKKVAEVKDGSDRFRMWAAMSFAVMFIVVGIPLWWKTTEVHRVALPYERISQLNPSGLQMAVQIYIYTEYPSRTNAIIRDLYSYFSPMGLYSIQIKPRKIDIETLSIDVLENAKEIHPKVPGKLLLIQVPEIPSGKNILVSNKRTIYFTSDAKSSALGYLIKNWFLHENDLNEKITSIVSPEKATQGEKESHKRLRASLSYDIIFTVVNSDPEHINLVWDIKATIDTYVKPLLEQMSEVGEHKAKSQWLYLVDLGEKPSRTKTGEYVLTHAQLPHIITPLEKKLGSGISKNPCVHLILYTSSCDSSPLSFVSARGDKVAGMISPQWGAIQILNPEEKHCSTNKTVLTPLSHRVMTIFVSQLHNLLGVSHQRPVAGTGVMTKNGPLLRLWELDLLYRLRAVEQITSASLTLQSLAKLLGEISNIVINEDVANSVTVAVDSIEKAVEALKEDNLVEGLAHSRLAYREAEKAFSNPSLLALLYFPDDQKYAVYIPLFLPIMIPVLMSLKTIYRWFFGFTNLSQDAKPEKGEKQD